MNNKNKLKIIKIMNKNELKEGEIYAHPNGNIVKAIDIGNDIINGIYIGGISVHKSFVKQGGGFIISEIRLAIPEEKHWLNTCIKQDKFISYKEATKTFIPEYVEAIQQSSGYTIGKIYKTLPDSTINHYISIDDENRLNGWGNLNFKSSTKEAYDNQFVVKEPEFVLPYAWYVVVNKENLDILSNWISNTNGFKVDIGGIVGICNFKECLNPKGWNTHKKIKGNFYDFGVEITFEQFKKYVLKEETVEEKVIEPLPQFKVIETIETITKVENNEGNQFFIGDKIVNKVGIVYTIKEFKYNSNKANILAVTNIGNVIGIDKIEHYIEDKKPIIIAESTKDMLELKVKGINSIVLPQESLLEKAKRLYPIGTIFKNAYNFKEAIVKSNNFTDEISRIKLYNEMSTISVGNWTIYNKNTNTWAEIIGYEPQIGDKFNRKDFSYPTYNEKFSNSIYTIVKFQGSYDNPNSVITFRGDNWIGDYTSTVLLKNIKLIK